MKLKSIAMSLILLTTVSVLGACNTTDNSTEKDNTDTTVTTDKPITDSTDEPDVTEKEKEEDHMEMEHSESGELPEGIKDAEDPKYAVGSKVKIKTDHMEGMDGAEGTVVGAYDTTAYEVSYDPVPDGKREENHKWVVREEIINEDDKPLEPGTEVVLDADHMKGMEGASAVIEDSTDTTVYMVDYVPTTGGREIKNHKWVTEEELEEI